MERGEESTLGGRVKVELTADTGHREGQILEMVPEPRTRRWKEGRQAKEWGEPVKERSPPCVGSGARAVAWSRMELGGDGGR